MRYSKEFIRQLHQSLPEEIQDVIAAPETLDLSSDIASEFSLTMQQENSLGYEITLLLMGLTRADEFVAVLVRELHISTDTANTIASSIHEKLLGKIPEEVLSAQESYAQAKLQEAGQGAYLETSALPQTTPNDLPEVVPGQVAHDARPLTPERSDGGRVPHIETTAAQPAVVVTPTPAPTPVSITKTAPSDASVPPQPAEVPPAPKSIVEEKLSQVVAAPTHTTTDVPAYAPGKDPYREPLV